MFQGFLGSHVLIRGRHLSCRYQTFFVGAYFEYNEKSSPVKRIHEHGSLYFFLRL